MDKMLVVGFDSELKAYEGSRALQELQNEGSINLYAKAVIARDASGKVTVKAAGRHGSYRDGRGPAHREPDRPDSAGRWEWRSAPPPGCMGAWCTTWRTSESTRISSTEVADYLQPGKAAVVAEVWEEWTLPVDKRMEALGGVVFRRSRNEVLDIVIERDVEILNADLDELEAEYNQATGEAKANLQKKIDAAKAKLQATQDAIQAKIEASQKETEAKIKSLQEQAAKERGERKAKLEARIAELKADQKRRIELLKQAWELTKEALSA